MHNLTSKVKINRTCQTELLPQLDLLTLLCNLVEELCHFVGRVHGSGGSTNLFIHSYHYFSTHGIAPPPPLQTKTTHLPSIRSDDEGLTLETSASLSLRGGGFPLARHLSLLETNLSLLILIV